MRLRYAITLALGLLIAGSVVVAARVSLLTDAPAPSAPAALRPVMVAAEDIPFGASVTADKIVTQYWPQQAIPHAAFSDKALLLPDGQGARRTKAHIFAGEPLISNKLSQYGDLVLEVPASDPGRFAMVIRVRGEAAEGGLITPGDRIDLVLILGEGRDRSAVVYMQGVRVLGVRAGGLLTVEVSRRDAQKLGLAQEAGVLVALLHLGLAETSSALETVFLDNLVDQQKTVSESATEDGPSIIVRRAGKTFLVPLPLGSDERP